MDSPGEAAAEAPLIGLTYRIQLCSGEQQRWRYLGIGEDGTPLWCDTDSDRVFSESSLMYAWQLIAADAVLTSGGKP